MKRNSFVLFIYLLIDIIAFSSVLPLLPEIIKDFSKNSKDGFYAVTIDALNYFINLFGIFGREKWMNTFIGGFLGSILCLFQFLFSPLFGALSDYFGRRKVLLSTSLCILASYLIWALSIHHTNQTVSYTVFFVTRAILGASRANVAVSIAIIGDLYTPLTHSSGMAIIGIAYSLGFMIGPVLGALVIKSVNHVAWLGVCLMVVDCVWIWSMLEESLDVKYRVKNFKSSVSSVVDYINPISIFLYKPMTNLKESHISKSRKLGFVYFSYLVIYSGLEFTLTFLTHSKFHFTNGQQGKMFMFMGLVMIIVQGGFVRQLRKLNQERNVIKCGLVSLSLSLTIIPLANTILYLYLGLFLFAIASSCVIPCLTTLVSNCDNQSNPQKGTLMGILRSQGSLARTVGPLIFASLFWIYGPSVAYISGGVAVLLIPLPIFVSL